jgi:hypothetical protein
MMDIQVFHKYNELADAGIVKSLLCQHCDQKLVVRIDSGVNPYLLCPWCNVSVHPGLSMYKDILAVVKEHYIGTIG